jgi:hypothetical protein
VNLYASLAHPTQRLGVAYHLDRAEYYNDPTRRELVGIEVQTAAPPPLGNGRVDLMLTNKRAIDTKAWTGFDSKPQNIQDELIRSLQRAADKYLASANVDTMIFEFRGAVPQRARVALQGITPPAGKTLQFYATS